MAKKLLTLALVIGLVCLLAQGCDDTPTRADQAGSLVGIVQGLQQNNEFSGYQEAANMQFLQGTDELTQAGYDEDAMGTANFLQTGGVNTEAVQMTQVDAAQRGLYQSGGIGTIIDNPDGTVSDVETLECGSNIWEITVVTTGYAFFIDNVTAYVLIDTLGDEDESTDILLEFSYTLCMKSGAVFSVDANLDDLDNSIVVLTASATGLPGIFGLDNVVDTVKVDINDTLDNDSDDLILEWQRTVYYQNGASQVFTLTDLDGDGYLNTGGQVILGIVSANLPVETEIDTVTDTLYFQLNNLDNDSDDQLLYMSRYITFTEHSGTLLFQTDNENYIENGIVDLYVYGENIPEEDDITGIPTGDLLSVYAFAKVDNRETASEDDDVLMEYTLLVQNENTSESLRFDFTDYDNSGSLLTGTTKVLFTVHAAPGQGETDYYTLEVLVQPQGTETDTDDLFVSSTLTDYRRNGKKFVVSITPDTPVLDGEDPDTVTIVWQEYYSDGTSPKHVVSMTFNSDGSASGTVSFYTSDGDETQYSVTIDAAGKRTITKV